VTLVTSYEEQLQINPMHVNIYVDLLMGVYDSLVFSGATFSPLRGPEEIMKADHNLKLSESLLLPILKTLV